MRHAAWILAVVLIAPAAHADDDKADSLTVLPWSDTAFAISSEDKRAIVQYTQLSGNGFGIHAKTSAPLDDDTHIASFTSRNRLTPGFSASLQLGLDTRAARLAVLESATRAVAEAVRQLSSFVPVAEFDVALNALARDLDRRHMSSGTAYTYLCQLELGPTAPCGLEHANEFVPRLCAKYLGQPCKDVDEFIEIAPPYWADNCLRPGGRGEHLACVLAGPIRHSFGMIVHENVLKRVLGDADTIAHICKVYRHVKPDDKDTCDENVKESFAMNATTVADAIAEFVKKAPVERRDVLMFAFQDRTDFAALFSASVSYDRASVYQSDIASTPNEESQYDVQIGADLTWYTLVPGLSANLRLGYERSRRLDARTFQRCVAETTTNPMVSGTTCDAKALLRTTPSPDAESSVFVRAAVDYQFKTTIDRDTLVPGVELRSGFENIGAGTSFTARGSFFATPVKGTTAARIGIALDVRHDFARDVDTPSWIITPLVFIGATFNDLMGH